MTRLARVDSSDATERHLTLTGDPNEVTLAPTFDDQPVST